MHMETEVLQNPSYNGSTGSDTKKCAKNIVMMYMDM